MSLDDLVAAACALVPDGKRAVLGIVGVPGVGKARLVEELVDRITWARDRGGVHTYRWMASTSPMFSSSGWASATGREHLETFDAAGCAALLRRLHNETSRPIYAPGFERVLEQPLAAAMVVEPSVRLVISEGNYILLRNPVWHEARAALDQVWLVQGDDEMRLERLVARHELFGKGHEAAESWVATVDEANSELIRTESDPPDRTVHSSADGWRFDH